MNIDFSGKVVLVTGGTSGIGLACATGFLNSGANVIIVGRDPIRGRLAIEKLSFLKGNVRFIKVNLSDSTEIEFLFEIIKNEYGYLDHVVHSAGMEGKSFTKLTEYPEDVWHEVMNLNVTSVWNCMKKEIPLLLKRNSGTIVNIASTAGLKGSYSGGCAYTASKHALVGLTKSAALEYATSGLRINSICPAIIRTPMALDVLGGDIEKAGEIHPMNRLGEPEEVANAVLWLSSNKAGFITGLAMPVDGGIMA